MEWKFWVPGPLPGFNEIVDAAKGCGGRGYGYSSMKKAWTEKVALHALAARIPKHHLTRVRLEVTWVERDSARDPDNVEAGAKFLWDGLVHAKVLPNDRRANNAGTTHTHRIGVPAGVEVVIVPVE